MADRRQARRQRAVSLTWDEVRARRLARSSLTQRATDLLQVVHDVGGIHGITQQDVRDALWRDRTLVKAWTLRGTLHLHPAGELALWLTARRALSSKPKALDAWPDPKGVVHPPVSADELVEIQAAVWDAFDGRALLRDELATEVVRRVGKKHEGRLRSGFAFFTDQLVQGPPQGKWAYGPARPADFRTWFGDVPFDLVDVEEVDVEGHRAYVLAGDTEFPDAHKTVRLLPEYDVYVMGFREREHLVPARVREQVAVHGRGRYEGPAGVRFLLVDGVTAGLWERKKLAKRIELTVAPVRRFRRTDLEREVERYGAFLGLETVLTLE